MDWSKKMADAVRNDIIGGLRGYHQNMSLSTEQLQEECVQMRLFVIKDYMSKGILPIQDLLVSLNCIPVDCSNLDKCPCNRKSCGKPVAHFQIPQILFDYGLNKSISYIGSTDRTHPFLVYTKPIDKIEIYQKYRKRGKTKPWVYIDVTPNSEGLLDGYIFNAPLIQQLSIVAIFKDTRQLEEFQCNCDGEESNADSNFNFLDTVIKDKLVSQKINYYRRLAPPNLPNTQEYAAG